MAVRKLREVLCAFRETPAEIIKKRTIMKSLKLCARLDKFKELKSIHLRFNSPDLARVYSPFRMKLMCRSSGSTVKKLVVILPASIRKTNFKHIYLEYPLNKENPIEFMERKSERYLSPHKEFSYYAEWLVVLFFVIKWNHSLECVTIGDCNRPVEELFVLRDEQLIAWRKLLLTRFPHEVANEHYNVVKLASVELPMSGYVMKRVLGMIMDFPESNDEEQFYEYDDLVTWKYDGEEKMLREATNYSGKKPVLMLNLQI